MRYLALLSFWLICSMFGFSHPLAISGDDEELVPMDVYGPEIYIDSPLDNEEVETSFLDRVPLEESGNLRVRRSAKYKILESPGLHSHFNQKRVQDEDVLKINPHKRRFRRSTRGLSELHSDEVEDVDTGSSKQRTEGSDFSIENIPQAQKQTMNPAYYQDGEGRVMDKWVKAPYGSDYKSRSQKEEEDSQGESSSNVGVKNHSRTPRVNFITQQGQQSVNKDEPIDGPEARERERERERERDQQNNNNNNNKNNNNNDDDRYNKKPMNDRYYPPSYNKPYDPYERPAYPNPNTYNPYPRDQYGYNPYYEKYDPYDRYYTPNGIMPPDGLSRMTPPNGMSSSLYYRHQYNEYDDYYPRHIPNYYYSDKRFDPMEPRVQPYDTYRPYLQNNDVKPGRIIYYANLPEPVRTPGNYRSATARYGDPMYNYYYNNYDRDDYHGRTAKAINYPSTTMRVASAPVRSDSIRERSYYG